MPLFIKHVMVAGLAAAGFVAAASASAQPVSVGTELFISPMGEPFRGVSRNELMRTWFNGADTNHDGALSVSEMRADADRFFQILNTNKDREIDPTELRAYEEQVAPEIRVGVGGMGIVSGNARRNANHLSSDFSKTGTADAPTERESLRRGAGLYGLLAIPNPVASTDTNLNRGISPEEFSRAAGERFLILDHNHDGAIRFEELDSLPTREQRKRR